MTVLTLGLLPIMSGRQLIRASRHGLTKDYCYHLIVLASSSSWWSLGLEDDIICASYLCVREWLCRPILDLQSRAQSGHWKFAFVAGIQAAKWRRSLADCA